MSNRTGNKPWFRILLWGGFAAAFVVLLYLGMQKRPLAVEVGEVQSGTMTVTVDEDGKTRVVDHYIVTAPVTGMLGRVGLRPGDAIEDDSLLATLEAIEAPLLDARSEAQSEARIKVSQAALRQAKAREQNAKNSFEFAEREQERISELVAKGSLSKREREVAELEYKQRGQELESSRFGVKVARYELAAAQANRKRLEKSPDGEVVEIRSPIQGKVLRVLRRDQGVVSAGTPLMEVGDPNALEIVVDVRTVDAVQIEASDEVRIRGWGGDQSLKGAVRLVEPSAYTKVSALGVEEQRVDVIIDLLEVPKEGAPLGDGYRVEVEIVTWEGVDVLKAPLGALFRHNGGWAAFRVEEEMARLVPVEIGERYGLEAEIRSGLSAGDRLILHPGNTVEDGSKIQILSE